MTTQHALSTQKWLELLDHHLFYYSSICCFSGIFGAFMSIAKVKLKDRPKVLLNIDLIYSASKVSSINFIHSF